MSSEHLEILRPAFAEWLWRRRISLREAGAALGCSHERIRLICLPFDDPDRRVPQGELLERIAAYTADAIGLADFVNPLDPLKPA